MATVAIIKSKLEQALEQLETVERMCGKVAVEDLVSMVAMWHLENDMEGVPPHDSSDELLWVFTGQCINVLKDGSVTFPGYQGKFVWRNDIREWESTS